MSCYYVKQTHPFTTFTRSSISVLSGAPVVITGPTGSAAMISRMGRGVEKRRRRCCCRMRVTGYSSQGISTPNPTKIFRHRELYRLHATAPLCVTSDSQTYRHNCLSYPIYTAIAIKGCGRCVAYGSFATLLQRALKDTLIA